MSFLHFWKVLFRGFFFFDFWRDWVFCVYKCTMHKSGARRGQKTALDSLELVLQLLSAMWVELAL